MCSVVAGASLALQTASDYLGQRATAKSAQATMDAQAKAAVTEMNYKIQDLEQERTDAFDKAVAEISNVRLNSLQLNSSVKAAVNETMSGRTANMIVRSAEGDTARAVSSIQENYDRKSNEVDLNRERNVLSTKAYLENLNASAPKMPSRLTNFVNFGINALSAYGQAKAEGSSKATKNTKTSKSTGGFNVPTYSAPAYESPARQTFTSTYGSTWDNFMSQKKQAGSVNWGKRGVLY